MSALRQRCAADVFAQTALGTILGDLSQEIAAGSVSPFPTPAPGMTLYIPKPQTAVPAPALIGTGGVASFAPNLVKRSAAGQPFYSGPDYDPSYPAPVRAADVSSASPSRNGRSVSPARWNRPLLLPKANGASDTDFTPPASGSGAFVAPDWILVAQDGSNPTELNEDLLPAGGDGSVIGRYAYAIYDEGGLLDMNVAGCPSGTTAEQVAYKMSLAFADLTQLKDDSGNPLLTQAQIDSVVAWRALHPFSSRQELIDFLTGQGATAGTRAALQNALQYLGTFSRGLNQPSIAPDPNRPPLLAIASGGNSMLQSDYYRLNPSFLTIRAPSSYTDSSVFGRRVSDGTPPVQGEPQVKHRFSLNRIAWLTPRGPIANDAGTALNPTGDADVAKIIDKLHAAGFTDEFLKKGTRTNIRNAFGLLWDGDTKQRWKHRSAPTSPGPIRRLDSTATGSSREPDFFELLKATLASGALGKAAAKDEATGNPLHPYDYQQRIDYDVDRAVMQIGANIIDQFDFDGYASRIVFDNYLGGPNSMEIRGVENHPYLYRLRTGTLIARNPNPLNVRARTITTVSTSEFDSGVGLIMHVPELWNPHDESASLGDPRPAKYRIVVDSTFPTGIPDPLNPNNPKSPSIGDIFSYNAMAAFSRNASEGYSIGPVIPTRAPSTSLQRGRRGPGWTSVTVRLHAGARSGPGRRQRRRRCRRCSRST